MANKKQVKIARLEPMINSKKKVEISQVEF